MDEKEKAEQILNSYKCYLLYDIYNKDGAKKVIDINQSKSNAIEAVNLILDEQTLLIDCMDIFALDIRRKYWKEVKKQIAESEILNN